MEINIIVAIADNMAIGKDNSLLWHISEDLRYFKKTTGSGTVIMGRKTFQSIGKALPGRTNIVVTRGSGDGFPDDVTAVHSLDEAFAAAEKAGKPCFVIGGGDIYRQSLPLADTLYVTEVHTVIDDADTFFPDIDPSVWEKVSGSGLMHDSKSGYSFEFCVFRKKGQ